MSVGTHGKTGIEPTGEQYAEAVWYAREQTLYTNDRDLDRGDQEWQQDVFLGELAEQVAASYLSNELGLRTRLVDDSEDQNADLEAEGVRLDVKMRKLWEREDPDLIVRDRSATMADGYLMVEVSRTDAGYTANIAGWVSQPEVVAYGEPFLTNRSNHDKLLVDRSYLRGVDTLPEWLDTMRGDSR